MDCRVYSDEMIDSMRNHLEIINGQIITYPKFVFLCGKAYENDMYDSSNRGVIDRYIKGQTDNIFIVLSEKLWEDSFDSNIDLLTFEDFLAEVSDCIILLVESPGSFCELGAFAYADKLFSDKLILVIDKKYENDKSFIITGPTSKALKDGSEVVYAALDGTGLLSSSGLRDMLNKKISELSSRHSSMNKKLPNLDENKIVLSSFIIEILELIRILQPVDRRALLEIYKTVKNFKSFTFVKKNGDRFHNEIKFDYILKLLQVTNLIQIDKNVISSNIPVKTPNLMFNYKTRSENQERSRLLCRKYRYCGGAK